MSLKEKLLLSYFIIFHFVNANFFYLRSSPSFHGSIHPQGNSKIIAGYDGI